MLGPHLRLDRMGEKSMAQWGFYSLTWFQATICLVLSKLWFIKKTLKLTMGLEQYANSVLPSFVILPVTLYE